jgi:hypothetical protein
LTSPNSLRSVRFRRLRWRRGKNLAMLIGELLQACLQPLPRPLAAFGGHFMFDVGKTGEWFGSGFHR